MINYFEYFGLPCQYSIDESLLRKLFYKKSMQVHPDQQESDDNHDEASVNNEAYRILSDKHLRLKHIVEIHKGTIDEHTEKLNPEFLGNDGYMKKLKMQSLLMKSMYLLLR
jgi:molecular chaperone HscB